MASAAALAIVQGKYILIFEILKRLRAFQNLFFTEGVVTGNGCCNLLLYGDNVFEKCGINRDGAGEVGKPRYSNGKRHF